jgi:hypothetical protein
MKLLQLNSLSEDAVPSLVDSFSRLPQTSHKDGKYRLRRYSVIELRTSFWNAKEEAEISRLDHRDFVQSEDLNKHQGGMVRSFEEIEETTLQSDGMKEICLNFKNAFDLIGGQEVEIHQMRVKTLEDGTAPVSPEGIHQDGFDCLAIIGIDRHNIEGGELMVYESPLDEPFVTRALEAGEMIMLADNKLWHNAKPIKKITTPTGHGDWFILCAKK